MIVNYYCIGKSGAHVGIITNPDNEIVEMVLLLILLLLLLLLLRSLLLLQHDYY